MDARNKKRFTLGNLFLLTAVCAVGAAVVRVSFSEMHTPLNWLGLATILSWPFTAIGTLYRGWDGLWRGLLIGIGVSIATFGVSFAWEVQIVWYVRWPSVLVAFMVGDLAVVFGARGGWPRKIESRNEAASD